MADLKPILSFFLFKLAPSFMSPILTNRTTDQPLRNQAPHVSPFPLQLATKPRWVCLDKIASWVWYLLSVPQIVSLLSWIIAITSKESLSLISPCMAHHPNGSKTSLCKPYTEALWLLRLQLPALPPHPCVSCSACHSSHCKSQPQGTTSGEFPEDAIIIHTTTFARMCLLCLNHCAPLIYLRKFHQCFLTSWTNHIFCRDWEKSGIHIEIEKFILFGVIFSLTSPGVRSPPSSCVRAVSFLKLEEARIISTNFWVYHYEIDKSPNLGKESLFNLNDLKKFVNKQPTLRLYILPYLLKRCYPWFEK